MKCGFEHLTSVDNEICRRRCKSNALYFFEGTPMWHQYVQDEEGWTGTCRIHYLGGIPQAIGEKDFKTLIIVEG